MTQRLLILETSQKVGCVALAEGERVLGERRLAEARRHARDLVPFALELLSAQGWKARDLAGVIVSRGPGSYTGLRVGVMSAKTLAYATGCALLGIETFAALASQAPADAPLVEVLEDAQQGKVYCQRFERRAGEMAPAQPLRILPFADWLAEATPGACVTGPGLALHRHELLPPHPGPPPQGGKGSSVTLTMTDEASWRPHAESLLRLGLARLRGGERDDPFTLEPLYLRASEAELKWRK